MTILAALMIFGGQARAQIALHDGSDNIYEVASTNETISVTNTAGANVLVVLFEDLGNNAVTPSTLSWNGTTLTNIIQEQHSANTQRGIAIYYVYNPPAGTANLTATATNATTIALTAYTLSGVNTSVAPLVGGANTGTSGGTNLPSFTINNVLNGSWAAVNHSCGGAGNIYTLITINMDGTITNYVTAGNNSANGNEQQAGYVGPLPAGAITFTATNPGQYNNKDNYEAAVFTASGVALPKNDLWTAAAGTNWDFSSLNWTTSGVATNYANGDFVLFDDTAGVSAVNLATNLLPASVTVSNNLLAYVVSGVGGISGSGGLTKLGTNSLTLGGTNTYSGATTIGNGTLLVGGKISGAGAVTVNASATLGGTGTIAGAVTVQPGGNLAPGAGAGAAATLTLSNNLTLTSGSFTTMKVQTGGIEGQVVSGGTVTYGGMLTVTNTGGALVAGDSFKLFTAANYSGAFANVNLPALESNLTWVNTLSSNGTMAVAAIVAPAVTNLLATGVQSTNATLNGQVVSTGGQTPAVTLYYGPTDGGNNAAAWSNNVILGLQGGNFSYEVTGLSTNSTYYYTATATNLAGVTWAAPSQAFTTQAASDPAGTPTLIQYISGTDKDHTVPWQFSVSSGRLAGIATNIPVPSCWMMMGFGTYSYTQNTGSGMTGNNSETGFYTNTFAVPSAWAGKKIFLVFEGVMTDTSVGINGVSVGPTHQGGYYEFRYDVTPYVVVGANTNVLSVTVRKFSANASVEAAEEGNVDYWVFGGIFRPVYLEAKPAAYIDYVAANPLANGNITASTYLGGINANYSVQAFVTDTNNVMLGNVFSNSVSAGVTNVLLSASLPTPNTWSSESPTLYTLNVQLVDTNGVVVHGVTNQIGFRTVTFVPQQGFFINGKKVVMRGVCHHEEWPTTGRTSSDLQNSNDVAMMKDMNFNAVRESHYPEDKTFLQECDKQGMYVLEEMASYQVSGGIDTTDGITHIYEMIRRDVNDPSIIAWDNGNEGGWNQNLDGGNAGSTNYFGLYDIQNRMVVLPGAGGTFMNLLDQHYPTYSTFTNNLGAGKTAYACTEILHALYDGGGGASLQEYWDAERTAPNGVGMYVWSWDDEGIIRGDQGGIMDVRSASAPDGIVGPYREKEASYYSYKKIYSPVQIGAPNPSTFNGTLAVTNRFDFTDLNQCTFNWQLGWFPDAGDPTNKFSTNALASGFLVASNSGNFSSPSISPGSGIGTPGTLTLPSFPSSWTNYDALRLTATDPFGNNIYTWTWPLHTPAQIRDRILGAISISAPAITAGTNATEIIVTNGPRIFHFSKTTGVINSLLVSNLPVSFTNGPVPAAGSAWFISSITNYTDGTNYFVGVNNLASTTNAFLWTLRPDGWLKLNYQYWLTGTQSFMGITFNYPSNQVTAMNWLGQGPYRVWKNRSAGQEIFTHTKTYNFPWTGQSTNYGASYGKPTTQWTYPEFEGYHGQLYWATLQTTEQPITIVTPTTNLFLRVFTPPATDQANTYRDPPFPSGGISLLHGISAIGDKFELPSSTGPAGQTNVAAGLYTGEANFFFGALPPSGADRDGNGLIDSWELQYFGALGQNPRATTDVDGQPLLVENAFGLSPLVSNAGLSILPHWKPGGFSPVALAYRVPVTQLDFYNFIPKISGNLLTWFGADLYPQYFLINPVSSGGYESYAVEPNLSAWPGNTNALFLNLSIEAKK